MLIRIYERLLKEYGQPDWWPVKHGLQPEEWEIMVGAVLTQNTNWSNVEKALEKLSGAGVKDRKSLIDLPEEELAELIRPSGYFRQKAKKLRFLAGFEGEFNRENLLSIWGIGKETADSILLYARDKAYFVVDAYTMRIFSRLNLIPEDLDYDEVRAFFETRLPRDPRLYKDYHALIVTMAKEHCTKSRPACPDCPMGRFCKHGR